jgi:hypothetical protein
VGIKDDGRVNSSMIYLIYCKNFCKCHNVPLPSTTIKKGKKKTHEIIKKKKKVLWLWLCIALAGQISVWGLVEV